MLYIIIPAVIILVDRISKYYVLTFLKPIGSIIGLPGVFDLTYVENTGAAFSMLSGKPYILAALSGIVIVVMSYFLWKAYKINKNKKWYLMSIAMIIGGAAGNLIDRVFYGYVVDFFEVTFVNFAIFNVADSFITIGAILFCGFLLFDKSIKI